jgi:integrase/recombinase XerD
MNTMTTYPFQSPFAPRMQAFMEMRRALGRKAVADRKILRYIDRYLVGVLQPGEPITREIFHQWLNSIKPLSAATRINRVSIFRQFCRYLSYFDRQTYLIPEGFLPKRIRPMPYIYTDQQIRTAMAAARRVEPKGSFRPVLISTLIGLLYSTGLRVSEALKLTLGDIDLKRRFLLIRQTKFKKSRCVPISISTTKSLRCFLEQRRRSGFPTDKAAWVFINRHKNAHEGPYGYYGFYRPFQKIVQKQKIRVLSGSRSPRIHDLRHSFAVHRLEKWYREGAILSSKLPLLSTYLGHSSPVDTEVYLQATPQLLAEANRRFHDHCAFPNSGQKLKGGLHV